MFSPKDLPRFPKLPRNQAQVQFIRTLQNAHAGELAAALAYTGHYKSLFVFNKLEKDEIKKIRDEELHHRHRMREMLQELGAKPRFLREVLMSLIGGTIGFLCLFGGWFIPMYGAGQLESTNIFEYEVAARLAFLSGHSQYVDELLAFGELEWDHEIYFRKKTESHFLARWIPLWVFPAPKESIRNQYEVFTSQ